MSQIGGIKLGNDSIKSVLRPPLMDIPSTVVLPYSNAAERKYSQMTVAPIDTLGNGVAFTRNTPARTVYRSINQAVHDGNLHTINLINCAGQGVLTYGRVDGVTLPTGYLTIRDDQNTTTPLLVLAPGASTVLPAGLHRVIVQASGAAAGAVAVIVYPMEISIGNVIFDTQPDPGTIVNFGTYVAFELVEDALDISQDYYLPVVIGATVSVTCDNLVTAFNNYVAAIAPAASQVPYYWARKISASDAVYYRISATGAWSLATDVGVQFMCIESSMITELRSSAANTQVQIYKYL